MRQELEEIKREYIKKTFLLTDDGNSYDHALRTTLEAFVEALTAALEYMSDELDRIVSGS